jgi:uncharacterized protein
VPEPAVARIGIRVRPGARRTRVGGARGQPSLLVVEVTARAVDGAATEAALRALAEALGVRRRQLTLVSGSTSREKVVAVDRPPRDLAARVAELRGDGAPD